MASIANDLLANVTAVCLLLCVWICCVEWQSVQSFVRARMSPTAEDIQ